MNTNKPLYKRGDKLEASEYHKENDNLLYVTITSINTKNKVYHWEATFPTNIPGTLHSGYYFHEAVPYKD